MTLKNTQVCSFQRPTVPSGEVVHPHLRFTGHPKQADSSCNSCAAAISSPNEEYQKGHLESQRILELSLP